MIKPFLKWAGGKSRTLPHLLPHFDKDVSIFVEPFCGSGVVWLNAEYEACIASDTNPDLINLYKNIQQGGTPFIEYCRSLFVDGNNEKSYYRYREEFNWTHSEERRSVLFMYLNRHCYNGLCRYNKKGRFNVPFGKYVNVYFPRKEMNVFLEKSRRTIFHCEDYYATLSRAEGLDCMIYVDPPYLPISKTSSFVDYVAGGFDLAEQKKLVEKILRNKNKVVVSNSISAKELYDGFRIEEITSSRSISAKANSRGKIKEIIAIKEREER